MKYEVNSDDLSISMDIHHNGNHTRLITKDQIYHFEAVLIQPGVYSVLMNNQSFLVGICSADEGRINVEGRPMSIEILDEVHLRLRELGWDTRQEIKAGLIIAQIPGLITKILPEIGDDVAEGDALFLMEAMKMENEIKSPVTGTVQKILVEEGQTVKKGTIIIEIG